jgi:2'-hydroxyisoflavone reductase
VKVLVLGGTVFLGRHLVDAALARGHSVTVFHRGQHHADLPPQVERLRGDRTNGELAMLRERRWDAVIDTSGHLPRIVRASAELLAGTVEHYTFVSSISVYRDASVIGIDERAPLAELAGADAEEESDDTFGAHKALCERAAEAAMPGRVLHVRPGLIAGPYDPTDRFTYWPRRIARGGAVLVPGRPERAVQFIDARDLAGWIVRMAETRRAGVFNATGPERPLPMRAVLETCQAVSGSDATLTWVPDEIVLAEQIQPWTELPLWIPESRATQRGFMAVNCARAVGAGLTFRPLVETVRDTLAWDAARPRGTVWQAGLQPEREAGALARWRATNP